MFYEVALAMSRISTQDAPDSAGFTTDTTPFGTNHATA